MSQSPRAGRRTALALSLLVALGLTACGTSSERDLDKEREPEKREKAVDRGRYEKVIKNPRPTPQEVIDVSGAPDGAVQGEDGSVLLSFHPGAPDDDEGPAVYAWRLYSPESKRVADHAEKSNAETGIPGTFHSCAGGFLFAPSQLGGKYFFLDTSGKKHPVTKRDTPRNTRPGDVLAGEATTDGVGATYAYRPSTRTVAPVPLANNRVNGLTVDSRRGTAWAHDQGEGSTPHRIVTSAAGGRSHPLPAKYSVIDLAARGGTFVAYTDRGVEFPKDPVLHLTRDGVRWWTVRGTSDMPMKDFPLHAEVDVLSDGRVLVTDAERKRSWLSDTDGDEFTRLRTPVGFVRTSAQGRVLYGVADSFHGSYKPVRGEGLWRSDDGGRHWTRFRDGRY
ncbi:hypothetical protein [Streptomyces sp. NPDC005438]|uniref:hypothetical protein n=1 Tax=Streptomyces sp. NPDC005438 TaxID=3156880 RepID=UPI0033B8B652